MIRPRYAFLLARTKLRSKRGVLMASVITASLLFSALIAVIIIFSGAEKSSIDFIKASGNDRYLVKVSPFIPYEKIGFAQDLSIEQVREIETFEKQYYTNLRAKYKELGIEYDQANEVAALEPALWKSSDLPDEQRVSINFQSPVISALETEKHANYAKTANNKFSDLQVIGAQYEAAGYYLESPTSIPAIPNTRLIQSGKEDFGDSEMKGGDLTTYGYFTNAVHNNNYLFVDEHLLDRYVLKDTGDSQGIPVVVSAQEAAEKFGQQFDIGKEPEAAIAKVEWLKKIQSKLNGFTYQSCYRNDTELALLSKIQRDYSEIKSNENNKDYVKPSLLYEYPTTPCGEIKVRQDTRTADEKKTDAKAEEIQKKLGTYSGPEHRLLTFQIVGFINAQRPSDDLESVESYVKNLLNPQDTTISAIIPLQAYASLPNDLKFVNSHSNKLSSSAIYGPSSNNSFAPRVLEFPSINEARDFMKNETCPSHEVNCSKKFLSSTYGSNYLILDEIGKLFTKLASISFPAVLGLAAIIIWFTVSRIMAENRRETAIYRAMGAKRIDITAIYFVYISFIAVRIALISLLLGIGIAYTVNITYGSQINGIATASFGIIDNAPSFTLFDLSSPLLWGTVLSIFAISIIASVQPLIRNVLRSPIKDMRED